MDRVTATVAEKDSAASSPVNDRNDSRSDSIATGGQDGASGGMIFAVAPASLRLANGPHDLPLESSRHFRVLEASWGYAGNQPSLHSGS
jgi:hypothetical protein